MLQQRAGQVPFLCWTNTCCSHQREGETNIQAGNADYLKKWVLNRTQRTFHFIYKAPFDNGLTEHELDRDDWLL
jgi:isopentenyl-diphosphate delta-isomerase